ncbi:MAG: apolipoprotein N-acyltransferase, partial [Pseudomonadota bacterium]|nr:apolipoprotein N-acyltransferase [Pseudomonadota bacterium]
GVWGYSLITYGLIISVYYFLFSTKKGLFFLFPFVFIIFVLPNILKVNENIVDVLNVRIVQPNIKQEDKWDERKLKKNLEKLSKIITLNDYKNFDLIVLPETALNLNVNNLNLEQYLENFDLESIKNFIVGTIRVEGEKKNIKIFNSMYLIKSDNKKPIYHDKLKLVPFGEFIPFKDTLGLNKLSDGAVDFSKGKKVKSLNINKKINFLPLICYEVIFPKLSSNIKGSYNLLINITNDAWYKKSSGPYQHFSLSKIRAVMEGLTLIRVANTGISGIIGPKGTTLIKLGLQKDGTIDYKLDIKEVKTIYGRHGESLFYLIMLTLLCHICISFFYGKSNKDKYL